MPTTETLQAQANRLQLQEEVDYVIKTYTARMGGEKIEVLELTPEGKEKRKRLTESLFKQDSSEHYDLPLGREFDFSQLHEGDTLTINGLLALSLIRRRTGGYVCTFTDDFSQLERETYRARIQRVNTENGTVRMLFDHWPGEYLHYEYFVEKPNLSAVNEPVSIGPECVVDFQILKDGKPHEDLVGWMKNVVKRNLGGKR